MLVGIACVDAKRFKHVYDFFLFAIFLGFLQLFRLNLFEELVNIHSIVYLLHNKSWWEFLNLFL